MTNHYQVLGIERSATIDQVKKAYRNLARKFHPDRNSGNLFATEWFKQINLSYEILSSQAKKEIYDRELLLWEKLDSIRTNKNPSAKNLNIAKDLNGQIDISKMRGEELLLFLLINLFGRALR